MRTYTATEPSGGTPLCIVTVEYFRPVCGLVLSQWISDVVSYASLVMLPSQLVRLVMVLSCRNPGPSVVSTDQTGATALDSLNLSLAED